MAGCRVVHHLAARVEEGELGDDALASRLHRINVEGSLNVTQAASRHGVERMVHVSSYAVYGFRSGDGMSAETPVSLDTPYGRSKWQAEEALKRATAESGPGLVILRPVLVAGVPASGPGERARHDLVGDIVRLARKGILPRLIGGGPARKALVHRDDVIAALLAAQDRAPPGRTYVVAAERSFAFAEIEAMLVKLIGRRVSVPAPAPFLRLGGWIGDRLESVGIKMPIGGRRVEKLLRDQVFDISREREELGYRPAHSDLEAMLRPYVSS
jgi:UDP-glucose 4-epimerase